jgi:hypothetical protein
MVPHSILEESKMLSYFPSMCICLHPHSIKRFCTLLTIGLLFSFSAVADNAAGADQGFKPIFDGKTLQGWKAPDMSYWSVKDGAITAISSPEHPCKKNQFITWQDGSLDDFELKLKFRIQGKPNANSGIQFRGSANPDGHVIGYQADIDRAGKWLGALYDEHTSRKLLAARGQKTSIDLAGKRKTEASGDAKALMAKVDLAGWNEYHITASGTAITLRINGQVTATVIDDEKAQRDLSGILALQIHSGPPMTIQFKDIQLKRLPLAKVDGIDRKKIVMVAGKMSHGPGDHEFNAGIKLLKKCLDENAPNVLGVNYHHDGWPRDTTAFDNADAVILYMDGGGRHPVNSNLEEVEALHQRGVGLMCMHYGVEVPKEKTGVAFKKWIGGYYESGFSINPHWVAKAQLNAKHPISNGVKPFAVIDEWYFNMRFRENMQGVSAVLSAIPDDEARSGKTSWPRGPKKHIVDAAGRSEILMWAVDGETASGKNVGRGVGFTGGHFHKNWADDGQRKLVLNGMLWVAGAKVPTQGVDSKVTEEDMKQNLDPKKPRKPKKPKSKKKK